jgi:chromosome segregation ATPase
MNKLSRIQRELKTLKDKLKDREIELVRLSEKKKLKLSQRDSFLTQLKSLNIDEEHLQYEIDSLTAEIEDLKTEVEDRFDKITKAVELINS